MSAPQTCGECVQHHEPRPYNKRGDEDTCSPRGTRWHLLLKADHAACRTTHAMCRKVDDDGQVAMRI